MLVISEPVTSCLIVMTWYSVGCLLFYFSVLVFVYFGWCVDEFQHMFFVSFFNSVFFVFVFTLGLLADISASYLLW